MGVRVDSPTPTQVRVTWGRPAQDTWNCDRIDYELWYQIKGEHFVIHTHPYMCAIGQREMTVSIPQDQTEYTADSNAHTVWFFKVRTKNNMGASEWTDVQQITTKQDRPGEVRNLVLDARGPNTVMASWLEPQDKKGVIVGYDVSYRLKHRVSCPEEEPRDVSQDWITVYNVKNNDYLITGLLPNAEYEVRVQARTTELGTPISKTVRTQSTRTL
jgi:hypothetical protein